MDFYEYIESTANETNDLQDGQRLYYMLQMIQQSVTREIGSPIPPTLANDLIRFSPAFNALYAYSEVAPMCLYNPRIWQVDCAFVVVSKEMSEERAEKTLTKRISAYSNIRHGLD